MTVEESVPAEESATVEEVVLVAVVETEDVYVELLEMDVVKVGKRYWQPSLVSSKLPQEIACSRFTVELSQSTEPIEELVTVSPEFLTRIVSSCWRLELIISQVLL